MSLGNYLREARERNGMTLRDVENAAKSREDIGAELSTGYLSLLERDLVKQPSPRILHAIAQVYHEGYIHLMQLAEYLPANLPTESPAYAFRGAELLDGGQKQQIQDNIDFLLHRTRRVRRPNT